jgi:hypothetical protein
MKHFIWIISALAMFTFSSCEQNDLMLSEKKLEADLEKTWKYIYAYEGETNEIWTFQNGTVTLQVENEIYSGTYSIDAKFSKAYVKLNNFSFTGTTNSGMKSEDLNRAWTIVLLKDNAMYLSAVDSRGAIRSLEYVKN